VLSGRPPLALATLVGGVGDPSAARPTVSGASAVDGWIELSTRIAGPAAVAAGRMKKVPGSQYQEFLNCPDGAFDNALRTLRTRIERDGEKSADIVAWTRAQQAVFANCESASPAIPEALPAAASPLARADRDYQIASAWFYNGNYEEAARRFRTIAG